jgi:hypothetical protein
MEAHEAIVVCRRLSGACPPLPRCSSRYPARDDSGGGRSRGAGSHAAPLRRRVVRRCRWSVSRYQFVMYPMYFAVPARLLMIMVVLALCRWTFCSLRVQDEVASHMREPR